MKKFLSKTLIALSIFNNANIFAMDTGVEKSENLDVKSFCYNQLIIPLVRNCIYKWDNTNDAQEEAKIDSQIANNVQPETSNALVPYFERWLMVPGVWQIWSASYYFYGRGICRNRAAWVMSEMLINGIESYLLLVDVYSKPDSKWFQHVAVIWRDPVLKEFYIADPEMLVTICRKVNEKFVFKCDSVPLLDDCLHRIPKPLTDSDTSGNDIDRLMEYFKFPLSSFMEQEDKVWRWGFIINPRDCSSESMSEIINTIRQVKEGKMGTDFITMFGIEWLKTWFKDKTRKH